MGRVDRAGRTAALRTGLLLGQTVPLGAHQKAARVDRPNEATPHRRRRVDAASRRWRNPGRFSPRIRSRRRLRRMDRSARRTVGGGSGRAVLDAARRLHDQARREQRAGRLQAAGARDAGGPTRPARTRHHGQLWQDERQVHHRRVAQAEVQRARHAQQLQHAYGHLPGHQHQTQARASDPAVGNGDALLGRHRGVVRHCSAAQSRDHQHRRGAPGNDGVDRGDCQGEGADLGAHETRR